ncbi:MAG TPA: sensor histidine kinase [Candidatus Competibacteraceae bacterium]|nr:sensor histidine kinase [Candidatus Competibacteraceae bacterium]
MTAPEDSTTKPSATTVATGARASPTIFGLRLTPTQTTFFGLFLPLFALTSLVGWQFLALERTNQHRILQADVQNRMAFQVHTIQQTFNTILSDLLFISDLDELHRVLDDDNPAAKAADKAILATDLQRFSSCKGMYDQVRYLDETGMEVVRINFNDGHPGIVPEQELQNKANHSHFREISQLSQGSIFVSPLDLHIERDQIERPFKPMIRFATPVFDRTGRQRGIVVLNYLAASLLADFKAVATDMPGATYLLNQDGYWLAHPDPTQEWGFMDPKRLGATFANAFPEAWHRIQGQLQGQFDTPQGTFTFATLLPLKPAPSARPIVSLTTANASTAQADRYRWIAVSFLPAGHLIPTVRKTQYWLFGFYGGIVWVFGIGAWLLALSRRRLQDSVTTLNTKVQELEDTRHELVQNEKMASLGRMVAGFAHEINTPIGIAVGAASHMSMAVKEIGTQLQAEEVREEDLTANLDAIHTAADLTLSNLQRAARLVQSFKRTSADQASEQARCFTVAEMVDDVLNSLGNIFKHTAIRFAVDCPPDLVIYGKPGVYAQILTNLLLNSHIHAFAEGSEPGIIRIWVRQLLEKWLWLIFEDDGRGMDETTRQRVFEPFFSTRRQHGGTGLGLYICHNLVTNELKGTIDCQSHLGQGTRWIIEHRLSDSASEEEPI